MKTLNASEVTSTDNLFDLQLFAEADPTDDELDDDLPPDNSETNPDDNKSADETLELLEQEFGKLTPEEKREWLKTGKHGQAGITKKFNELAEERKKHGKYAKEFEALEDDDFYNAFVDIYNAYQQDPEKFNAKKSEKPENAPEMPPEVKQLWDVLRPFIQEELKAGIEPIQTHLKAQTNITVKENLDYCYKLVNDVHKKRTGKTLTDEELDTIGKEVNEYSIRKDRPLKDYFKKAYETVFRTDLAKGQAESMKTGEQKRIEDLRKRKSLAGGGEGIGAKSPYLNADGTIDERKYIQDRLLVHRERLSGEED